MNQCYEGVGMKWIEISITVKRVATDEVTTLFSDYTDNGIVEEEVADSSDLIMLKLYGNMSKSEDEWVDEIQSILKDAHISVESIMATTIDEQDWYTSWQQYIEPTEILPNIIIKPAWKSYDIRPNDKVIEIDSQLSFGTGAHETTRSCAKLMNIYGKHATTCLDIGTGTGILLLIAHQLGIPTLVGIDIDASAVEQAQHNCKQNNVLAHIICGDLDSDFTGTADLIMANLTVDPLKLLLPVIGRKLSTHGILIISGIIDERYDEIMPYIKRHWRIKAEDVNGAWHTFVLEQLMT